MDIYFDFTCPYSRRVGRWWHELAEPARWRPFLLRENNREDDGAPEWERDDALGHVSVLALALHEAIELAGDDSGPYRWAVMDLFERGRVDAGELRELAGGLDDEVVGRGLAAVGESHLGAGTLSVFGTPTLVDGDAGAYLKLGEQPSPERARAVLDAVNAVLHGTPEIVEIKRPG